MFNKKTFVTLSAAVVVGLLTAASIAQAKHVAHIDYAKARKAFGYVNEGTTNGAAINGNFIPQGTSPAQVPSRHQEDNYGSESGKD